MAISPITNISFTSRKRTANRQERELNGANYSSSSSLKAVPLAALIAMSPLNPVNAQDLITDNNIVATSTYKKAVPDFNGVSSNPCEILFISTDGDNDDIEKVRLVFNNTYYEDVSVNNAIKEMKFDVIKQIDVAELEKCREITKYDYMPDKTYYAYYVSGAAEVSRSNYYNDNGEFVNKGKSSVKKDSYKMEITKDLYDYLLNLLGDNVKHNSVVKTFYGDEEFDRYHL